MSEIDLSGKIAVITGANSGIGFELSRELGRRGATVAMVCRNRDRAESARAALGAEPPRGRHAFEVFQADLSLLRDVRRVATELLDRFPRIDLLLNNAGIYLAGRYVTDEGNEATLAVNHLAPFLLTNLLLERLRATGSARVINTSTMGHRFGRVDFENLQGEKRYTAVGAYGRAKLANLLFTYELDRRLPDPAEVTVNAFHPGGVASNFARDDGGLLKLGVIASKPFLRSPSTGADTGVWLATASELAGVSGGYFKDRKPRRSSRASRDPALARHLWQVSQQLVGLEEALPASP